MIVMRNELNYLFQLIQTWPTKSETAELLLVTKDGNDVLFLNELRNQKNTALKLRIPLSSDPDSLAWPAISAVTGIPACSRPTTTATSASSPTP